MVGRPPSPVSRRRLGWRRHDLFPSCWPTPMIAGLSHIGDCSGGATSGCHPAWPVDWRSWEVPALLDCCSLRRASAGGAVGLRATRDMPCRWGCSGACLLASAPYWYQCQVLGRPATGFCRPSRSSRCYSAWAWARGSRVTTTSGLWPLWLSACGALRSPSPGQPSHQHTPGRKSAIWSTYLGT